MRVRSALLVVMVLLDVMYAISKAFGDGLAVFFVQYYLKLDNEVVATAVQFASTDVTLASSELRLHLFNFDAGVVWFDNVVVRL